MPRLLAADPAALLDDEGANLDPMRAWATMMQGEKPGGHGERCVAVGALDMAMWDAAAKIAGLPLYLYLASRVGRSRPEGRVRIYAGGGYRYPRDDVAALAEEMRQFTDLGYTHAKIKIGGDPVAVDMRRIEAAAAVLAGPERLAVDAMNAYRPAAGIEAAKSLARFGLWWFEDICDPLDFATLSDIAGFYPYPIATGEALFSPQEAALLLRHGGLRPRKDILVFDPVHCYGIPGYLRIIDTLERGGWPRSAFWPHGGHLMSLHVAAALGLGGSEVNPFCFAPFGGLHENAVITDGSVCPPELSGIGFEGRPGAHRLFRDLVNS